MFHVKRYLKPTPFLWKIKPLKNFCKNYFKCRLPLKTSKPNDCASSYA